MKSIQALGKTITLWKGRLAVATFFGCTGLLWAQPQVKTEHISLRDGLPYRWTLDVLQDRHGFLWIATYDGLCRYDGHQFVVYRHDPLIPHSISDNRVLYIGEDPNGYIWVNTEIGIDRFNPSNNQFEHLPELQQEGISYCFTVGDQRRVWRVHKQNERDAGIEIQEVQGKTLLDSPIQLPGASVLYWFFQKDNSTLLAYTLEGYWRIDLFTRKAISLGVDGNRLHLPKQTRVPVDAAGRIWYFDTEKNTLRNLPGPLGADNPDYRFFSDYGPGEKWLVSARGEIWYLNELRNAFEQVSSKAGDGKVFRDREGVIWSCSQQGLYKIKQSEHLFEHRLSVPFAIGETPPIGFSARTIAALPDDRIFVAEDGDAVEARTGRPFKFGETDIPENVWQIITGADGNLWFTSDQPGRVSLSSFDPGTRYTQSFLLPESQIFFVTPWLFQDKDKRFWIVCEGATFVFNPVSKQFTQSKTGIGSLHCAFYDDAENAIFGMRQGKLIRMDCALDAVSEVFTLFKTLDTQTPVAKGIVRHSGRFWVATTQGLYSIRETDRQVAVFNRRQGLPHDIVYSIVPDGDFLWLGTHEGLCRFNIETRETRNFFVEDGLSHNEFNSRSSLRDSEGRIWMGGLNGINVFDPRKFDGSKDQRKPRLLWSRCTWFDTTRDTLVDVPFNQLNELRPITVQPGDGNYTFYFALNTYAEPSQHTFSWYFERLDKTWGGWSNNAFVSFQTLPPGQYLLHVRGRDERGNLAQNELFIPINVLQVWYLRGWAIALYVLLGAAIVYVIFRVQLSRRLEHAENERLRGLDELKNRLYTNITHEFRTPLTLLLGPAEGALNRWRENYPSELKSVLTSVQQNAYRLLNLVNQILDLRKLEEGRLSIQWVQGDIMLRLRYITDSFHSLAEHQKISLDFQGEPTALLMDYDKDKLLKMLSNLLSNAFKFTPVGGKVQLAAQVVGDSIHISVRDNGCGISPAHLPKVFERFFQASPSPLTPLQGGTGGGGTGIGLALVKELAELLGGHVGVESTQGLGSVFTVVLPIHRLAHDWDTMQDTDTILHHNELGNVLKSTLPEAPVLSDEAPLALVVDDNAEIARYVGQCLSAKYRIEYASNGMEGIEKAIALIPDFVVSDLMMPEKDGFELTQILKNDERTSHIPIILLTARAEVAARLEGLRRGADAYLSKPFNEEELMILAEQQMLLRRRLQQRYSGLLMLPVEEGTSAPEAAHFDPALEDAFFQKVLEAANAHITDADFGPESLARAVFISQSQLNRKLDALTGKSAVQILRDLRLRRAQTLLRESDLPVSEVAWDSGFNDPAYFSRVFTREFGLSPSLWRERNGR